MSLSHDADWLTVDPEAFTVAAEDSVNAAFTTDADGMYALMRLKAVRDALRRAIRTGTIWTDDGSYTRPNNI